MEFVRRLWSMFGVRGIPEGMHDRVPDGQSVTPKMPVMNLSYAFRLSTADWRLSVTGLVDREIELTWEDFLALASVAETVDFHCVTQWTRLNVAWEGVAASTVLELASPRPEARYAMFHCPDGYATNVDLAMVYQPEVLFAHKMDGEPLAPNHGYPVRLVVPARYGWKSAKWVTGVELLAEDQPGFWELNGYHMRGNPWREERFSHGR
jgi:DMSO/TMAO reductase YedYZ molybdopterin-dependent catalytic subunit